MAFDSRSRPVRRLARRRIAHIRNSSLTALALLMMAAGLWFSGPAAASAPVPRTATAEVRVADSPPSAAAEADTEPEVAAPAVVSAAPIAEALVAAPVAVVPAVGGPRAPPVASLGDKSAVSAV